MTLSCEWGLSLHLASEKDGRKAQYVLDFLNAVESDIVALDLKDDVSQAVMKPVGVDGYDYTYVIMPMRV